MIIRLDKKLATKTKEGDLSSLPADPNPLADWTARLFTADRTQYILISNTASLYSMVTYGKGIKDADTLIHGAMDVMRDVMGKDGFGSVYETQVAPQAVRVFFAKALNRSVTGSMNDLEFQAKLRLIGDELSPFDASFQLNEVPMSYLKYQSPREAFLSMAEGPPKTPE